MKFSLGEIVNCYEMFGDMQIVKERNIGLITARRVNTYGKKQDIIYTVFFKGKQRYYEEYQIEKINF